ncbi:MAG: hypothetical protein KC457_21800 [Myxococcales bacterium]|nr:hypothetical protein [Myxococcales bacterium]
MSAPRRALALTLLLLAACQATPVPVPTTPVGEPITVPAGFDVEGHRGNRGNLFPGNTLPAYASALAMGVDTIEADMQISAEGQVFMGHDDDLEHTGCTWAGEGRAPSSKISRLNTAQIGQFDCHTQIDGIQPPPRLDTFLDAFFAAAGPETALNLELKQRSNADADVYLQALIAYDQGCDHCLRGRLILQSFQWSALRYARANYGDAIEFRAAILDKRGKLAEIEEARAYAEIWSPKHPLVTPELLAEVQALDMQAIPWTVNEPARMRELITMGVDGIITDYPDLLLQLIGRAPTP